MKSNQDKMFHRKIKQEIRRRVRERKGVERKRGRNKERGRKREMEREKERVVRASFCVCS